jgi:hypothetical protein
MYIIYFILVLLAICTTSAFSASINDHTEATLYFKVTLSPFTSTPQFAKDMASKHGFTFEGVADHLESTYIFSVPPGHSKKSIEALKSLESSVVSVIQTAHHSDTAQNGQEPKRRLEKRMPPRWESVMNRHSFVNSRLPLKGGPKQAMDVVRDVRGQVERDSSIE